MAQQTLSFGAAVEAWAHKVPEALDTIRKMSAQDVVSEMQTPVSAGGRMRVDTGFHRASLLASTSQMPTINPAARPPDGAAPNSFSYEGQQIELVIAGSDVSDPLFFGYVAAYAGVREYRDGHVRLAAQNWREIVFRNAAKVRTALGI
jgi:hypothetical protein